MSQGRCEAIAGCEKVATKVRHTDKGWAFLCDRHAADHPAPRHEQPTPDKALLENPCASGTPEPSSAISASEHCGIGDSPEGPAA